MPGTSSSYDSKSVHREASPVLYSCNRFEFCYDLNFPTSRPPALLHISTALISQPDRTPKCKLSSPHLHTSIFPPLIYYGTAFPGSYHIFDISIGSERSRTKVRAIPNLPSPVWNQQLQLIINPMPMNFFNFPAEIRLQIYEELLVLPNPILFRINRDFVLIPLIPRYRYGLCPALLRANKTVHREASPLLYSGNCFGFADLEPLRRFSINAAVASFLRQTRQNASFLRHRPVPVCLSLVQSVEVVDDLHFHTLENFYDIIVFERPPN